MLELIGLIAVLYLAFKFLPDFLMFLVKMVVGIIVLILFLNILFWVFNIFPVILLM